MSESFTPGPWHVDGFHMSAVIRETETGWERIAECDSEAFRNANWRADARLIAAAPELFEALKAMLLIEPRDLGHVDVVRTYGIARAALLKASPEQSE